MKKGLISVIVPCFNVSKYLEDTFASLESQTYENLELIFVNDGSPDDCLEKIQKFCKGKTNCKIVDQENQGLSAARNAGLSVAEGEFVYFYDSDDLLSPNILEVLHKLLSQNNCDLAICSFRRVKEKFSFNKIKTKNKRQKIKEYDRESAICQHLSMNLFFTTVWNRLYKHSILKNMEKYPNVFVKEVLYGEDLDFNVRYMQLTNKTIFTNQKLYFYRMRKGSLVHSKFNEKLLSELIGIEKVIEICKNQFPAATKYAIGFKCVYCTDILYKAYKSEYSNKSKIKELYAFLKENVKVLRRGKKNPLYRRLFMWTVPVYFRIVLRKKLK